MAFKQSWAFFFSFVEDVPLEYLFAVVDVLLHVAFKNGLLSLIETALVLAVELADEENQLQNAAQSGVDLALIVAGVVLGEDQLGPQFLDDPVAEIIVLVEIYLLAELFFAEMGVDFGQFLLNFGGFLLERGQQGRPF